MTHYFLLDNVFCHIMVYCFAARMSTTAALTLYRLRVSFQHSPFMVYLTRYLLIKVGRLEQPTPSMRHVEGFLGHAELSMTVLTLNVGRSCLGGDIDSDIPTGESLRPTTDAQNTPKENVDFCGVDLVQKCAEYKTILFFRTTKQNKKQRRRRH